MNNDGPDQDKNRGEDPGIKMITFVTKYINDTIVTKN